MPLQLGILSCEYWIGTGEWDGGACNNEWAAEPANRGTCNNEWAAEPANRGTYKATKEWDRELW